MDRYELLNGLEILAAYLPYYYAVCNEINERKGKIFKSRQRDQDLLRSQQMAWNYVAPYIGLVPQQYHTPEALYAIRDNVKFGRANSIYEAISLYQMQFQIQDIQRQAAHDRYMRNVATAISEWRRY
ncbi:MAG: hypothetical protein K6E26_10205 [Clostridiales bacterium]|nr:hypothetical protein [Clostridiales bacterium]